MVYTILESVFQEDYDHQHMQLGHVPDYLRSRREVHSTTWRSNMSAPQLPATSSPDGYRSKQRPQSAIVSCQIPPPLQASKARVGRTRPVSAGARLIHDPHSHSDSDSGHKIPGWPNPGDLYEHNFPSAGPWTLDMLLFDGKTWLLDCTTRAVYAEQVRPLPRLVGHWKVRYCRCQQHANSPLHMW